MNDVKQEVLAVALAAREASAALATTTTDERNGACLGMAAALREHTDEILQANELDMAAGKESGMNEGLLDRLMLDAGRIEGMASALEDLAALPDPVGRVIEHRVVDPGLDLSRVSTPLGVVAMVYEARPNVTADAAGICIKTANACVLRGGAAALHSNVAIASVLSDAASAAGMPENSICVINTTDRAATDALMELHGIVDVLIPRGGAGLIRHCVEHAKVPVIETGTGNCHIYVHESADFAKARAIVINAKTQRVGVCNAAESLLVDESIAEAFLPQMLSELAAAGVIIHGDAKARECAAGDEAVLSMFVDATEDDWGREYLALDMSVKCVTGIDEAIPHINRYGTGHSESIVAEDVDACERFLKEVDASTVYSNVSTRFTDGGCFGLGAEIGISTQKLHVRGPFALEALTSSKYVVRGSGQVRA